MSCAQLFTRLSLGVAGVADDDLPGVEEESIASSVAMETKAATLPSSAGSELRQRAARYVATRPATRHSNGHTRWVRFVWRTRPRQWTLRVWFDAASGELIRTQHDASSGETDN